MTEVVVKTGGTLMLPLLWPIRRLMALLDRLTVVMDESELSRSPGALRLRRALATLFLVYGIVLTAQVVSKGGLPSLGQALVFMLAFALYTNRGGRFVRDWAPVLLGLYAYSLSEGLAYRLELPVRFLPQIDVDRVIGLGSVPTVWLQHHLYRGVTGPLEIFSLAMYASHFLAPLAFAFYVWSTRRRDAFTSFFFGILTVSVLAEITFVLVPTAPPWMAAQHGLLPPVHHVMKQALYDLHLTTLAAADGDSTKYNVVAAVPSLHVAWPVIGLLVSRACRLPRWVVGLQLFQLFGVMFAVVYSGEHYVVDVIAGAIYAGVAFVIVRRALRRPGRFAEARARRAAQEAAAR